jgi:hypothetical protein
VCCQWQCNCTSRYPKQSRDANNEFATYEFSGRNTFFCILRCCRCLAGCTSRRETNRVQGFYPACIPAEPLGPLLRHLGNPVSILPPLYMICCVRILTARSSFIQCPDRISQLSMLPEDCSATTIGFRGHDCVEYYKPISWTPCDAMVVLIPCTAVLLRHCI